MTDGRRSALRQPGGPFTGRRGGPRGRSAAAVALRLLRPGGVLIITIAAVSYIAAVDPNEQGHYPTCPFLALTGFQCPGCGSMRTIHALAHGHVQDALALNVLTVAVIPALIFFWARWALARAKDRPTRTKVAHPAFIWAFFGVILLFWLVRNLPFGSFLAA
ncbi:DUF2752 domain-containing protein [Actinomadura sp. 7K534]|uniref:DUF2752 domain-containing protein n=1 Tax=Actinomadura sp. 7K534 TaxID=2530366 RepID=UPI001FB657DE|nr:DUF2752 domain-containing protein [Actinomadura sp. 7K534]